MDTSVRDMRSQGFSIISGSVLARMSQYFHVLFQSINDVYFSRNRKHSFHNPYESFSLALY